VMLGSLCGAAELVYRSPTEPPAPPAAGPTPLGPGFALKR
jgi:hypothetical protein